MNELDVLKTLLQEFKDKIALLEGELIPREVCFPEAPKKIKVAIGMRRAGKTYILYSKILELLKSGIPLSQILYINFEDDRLLPLTQKKLSSLIESFYSIYPENHEKKCYLFLDEIQNVEDWPIVVRRFHDTKNVEIFLTGSSAKLLSKEIATSLRGRSLSIEVWPYSLDEFIRSKKMTIDRSLLGKKGMDHLKKAFQIYLSEGGFPEVTDFEQDVRQQTLQEYVDIVLYRDIIERHSITNPGIVKWMILSIIHNVSQPFSINKFYNEMKTRGHKIGKDSLYEYMNHIEDAFLAFSISMYDRSIRKSSSVPKKVYAIDPGLVRSLTLDFESDLGKLFENVIFLEFKRLGYHLSYYLTQERYEIDFLVQSPKGVKKLFQVVWDSSDPKTNEREERALKSAMKELNLNGEIISLDSYLKGENELKFA